MGVVIQPSFSYPTSSRSHFPVSQPPQQNLNQNVLCQDCRPRRPCRFGPNRRCTCDRPAMPCWPSNPLSSPWLLPPQCAPFRPLLCPGTLTLPPNSLVPELPQLEWLDLVLESVASSDPSSSATLATHP